jgi:hypothetical protein
VTVTTSVEHQLNVPLVDLVAQYASIAGDVQQAINRILQNADFILAAMFGASKRNSPSIAGPSERSHLRRPSSRRPNRPHR